MFACRQKGCNYFSRACETAEKDCKPFRDQFRQAGMNSTKHAAKRRPKLFRALGALDPPSEIRVDGQHFQHERTIKHDSWAATALYQNGQRRIVCKFNRIQPILFIPCRWLGRWLAGRESAMYQRLADVPNISRGFSAVFSKGRRLNHAAAHEFIEGTTLSLQSRVDDEFFEKLRDTLVELHGRDIAIVDLNKRENIIVDKAGSPWLIDFQIILWVERFVLPVK